MVLWFYGGAPMSLLPKSCHLHPSVWLFTDPVRQNHKSPEYLINIGKDPMKKAGNKVTK